MPSGDQLERTLGLAPTFMIGAGTMLGAGIFVFPGLAGGRAGGGAALSFAIGGAVALLVALAASELATATPSSGGIINFADRAFGRSTAAILGLVQWAGLVFSVAFYLLGFGHYVGELFAASGFQVIAPPWTVGVAAGAGLTGLALIDTRSSGVVQKYLVTVLLVGLVAFIGYGLYAPLTGATPSRRVELSPMGTTSIFTTAALVFTSYLGFVQIANIAGDVVKPARTLPRAMIGSVIAVTVIYVLTMLVATMTFSPSELEDMGETALAGVAEARLGQTGRLLVLAAGLLATLSSANASILSSSRVLFALGRDRMVPTGFAQLNRFDSPHRALITSAIPACGLLVVGHLELFAEAASALHLLIYSVLCFALLRTRAQEDEPAGFRCPGYPALPVVGGLSCLALLPFFTSGPVIVAGIALAVACLLWFGLLRQRAR